MRFSFSQSASLNCLVSVVFSVKISQKTISSSLSMPCRKERLLRRKRLKRFWIAGGCSLMLPRRRPLMRRRSPSRARTISSHWPSAKPRWSRPAISAKVPATIGWRVLYNAIWLRVFPSERMMSPPKVSNG